MRTTTPAHTAGKTLHARAAPLSCGGAFRKHDGDKKVPPNETVFARPQVIPGMTPESCNKAEGANAAAEYLREALQKPIDVEYQFSRLFEHLVPATRAEAEHDPDPLAP